MAQISYKELDMFGNEVVRVPSCKRKRKTLFEDYEGFTDKFKPKLTTDDCYTPPAVYDCVLNYVAKHVDLAGCRIIRPFFPGMDYKEVDYSGDCVVIDNPPFSILSQIVKFYEATGVRFFLFAPHLTLFSPIRKTGVTAIVCGVDVVYENGAVVKTSFLTNCFGDAAIIGDPDLYKTLQGLKRKKGKVSLLKYEFPLNVLTVSMVSSYVSRGIPFLVNKKEVCFVSALDAMKSHKKGLFGGGFLLSQKAAAEKAAAEKAAAEKAAAEKAAAEKAAVEKAAVISWGLSEREVSIIRELE